MKKQDLRSKTKEKLLEMAKRLKMKGVYSLSKEQLVNRLALTSIKQKARLRKIKPILSTQQRISPQAESKPTQEIKFYYPRPAPSYQVPPVAEREYQLPAGYGDNKIILQTRDAYWGHAYWELTADKIAQVRAQLKEKWNDARPILRVYDVTDIIFNGTNAHRSFDIDLVPASNNWYINLGVPNRAYCVDIGYLAPDGTFLVLARSNVVRTPRDGPSDIIDEEWMTKDFDKLYAFSAGFRGSSPLMKKKMQEMLKLELASGASVFRRKEEKGFWLVADAELIVYGATDPNAKLTVQDRPVKLNKDGTFSLRFALPDGKQVIPIKAVSAGGDDKRSITPVVTRTTST